MSRPHALQVGILIGSFLAAGLLGQELTASQASAPAAPAAPATGAAPTQDTGRAAGTGRGRQAGANAAAAPAVPIKGRIERIKIFGKSLEGNLLGETDSPYVSIYLPPSYRTDMTRRYPVMYFLHGYNGTDLQYLGDGGARSMPGATERAFGNGTAREMIIVVPNCMNAYGGCFYSNSPTTGNWEEYVAHDLVAYIDSHYRTIATREGRGLAGQSMGGYGVVRIGMKSPDVFLALYALAPCCLDQGSPRGGRSGEPSPAELVKSVEEGRTSPRGTILPLATSAAWSPNPMKPPLYLDLPTSNGDLVPAVAARYGANSPLAMLSQYVPNLKKYKAMAIDVGRDDTLLPGIRVFEARLSAFGVPHTFTVRDGNHSSHVIVQFENKVLPFFTELLAFGQSPPARR